MPTPETLKAHFSPVEYYHVVCKSIDGLLLFQDNQGFKIYKERFKKIGLKVIQVIEPPDANNNWIVQYPIDYTCCNYPELYKDSDNIIPHLIISYKIDNNLHLTTDYYKICIQGIIYNMSIITKEKLVKYLNVNKQFYLVKNDYTLTFCMNN